jgi:hypothetical protein
MWFPLTLPLSSCPSRNASSPPPRAISPCQPNPRATRHIHPARNLPDHPNMSHPATSTSESNKRTELLATHPPTGRDTRLPPQALHHATTSINSRSRPPLCVPSLPRLVYRSMQQRPSQESASACYAHPYSETSTHAPLHTSRHPAVAQCGTARPQPPQAHTRRP